MKRFQILDNKIKAHRNTGNVYFNRKSSGRISKEGMKPSFFDSSYDETKTLSKGTEKRNIPPGNYCDSLLKKQIDNYLI